MKSRLIGVGSRMKPAVKYDFMALAAYMAEDERHWRHCMVSLADTSSAIRQASPRFLS